MSLRHDEREREACAYGHQQDAQHERHHHRLLEYAVQKRHLGDGAARAAQDERDDDARGHALLHEDARDRDHRLHADVHGDADDGGQRNGPEVVRPGEALQKLGRHEPVDEGSYSSAEEQPADDPPEQPDGVLEGILACLRLLLPERPLQVFPGGLVASAATALDGDVLDVAGEPERVEHEPCAHREHEGDEGVDRRGNGSEEHEQKRDDGRVEDGRRHQERDGSREGRAALEEPHQDGDGGARAERRDRAERSAQNRVGQLVRARQNALDALLRNPDLQQGHEEADGDEEQEELSEQVDERAQHVEQVLHGEQVFEHQDPFLSHCEYGSRIDSEALRRRCRGLDLAIGRLSSAHCHAIGIHLG